MKNHHHDPFGGGRRRYRDPFDPQAPRRGRRGYPGGPGFGPGGPGFGPGGPGFGPQGGPPPFGPGFEGRHGPGRGHRGRRAGRGDIRAAILLLLAEEPRHGYDLIREIGERTDGAWRPSPGAVYPALQLLEDEGLVTIAAEGGRRMASLTEAGRVHAAEHADELGDPFGEAASRTPHPARALRAALHNLSGAAWQVVQSGDEAQVAKAQAVVERATKDLYLLLAGQEPTEQ